MYEQLCEILGKNDPDLPTKQLWSRLDSIGVKKAKSCPTYHSPNTVNDFFVNNIPNLQVHSTQLRALCQNDSFSFQLVDEQKIWAAFSKIKSNACGLDGIPLKFLKIIFPFLSSYIVHLFNFIIVTGKFPKIWKVSKVFPLQKKPGNENLANLRPISILSCLSKAFEMLLKDQIVTFTNTNYLVSQFQSGYKTAHSTTTAILKVVHDISYELDQKKVGVLVLLDFSKAFDLLNHKLLCCKLKNSFGFTDRSVLLIESYLTNRSQLVCIDDKFSEPKFLLHGVPQGSILGPLLFSLFVNDITDCIKYSKFHMYADDLQVYHFSDRENLSLLSAQINDDLSRIYTWSKNNGMLLNASKSYALPLSLSNPPVISQLWIGNDTIQFVNEIKNLGFVFDTKLSWDNHVRYICGCIKNCLRKLRPAYFFRVTLKLKLFKSLILPYFNYGDIILSMMSESSKRDLRKTLNMCIRFVYNLKYDEPVSHLQVNLLGCPFKSYYDFRSNIFFFRLIKSQSPAYLFENLYLSNRPQEHRYLTPRNRTALFNRSFFVHGVSVWNSLPRVLKEARTLAVFRRELKIHYNS